ncbi:23S rRNA (adenine(2503)-C(2))-methyltransferase RlmN [Halanaerobacter jeridensis]|uniref:Probable dual-specificity RNA methyltransferase RlmN n=1 Tax=Halanaerobacter jeridensis TaxID=706427 RepID=A0A938XQL6_9FIRM|nr:23S rRNA (adenine(2503)-C(2))-methyltransferase RlmN [Halanaerobacter jeridensis]MBM7555513.1 23S rRNA (adenine2503-C2)-methyltransferase [Halanaerobacter jeridensis]
MDKVNLIGLNKEELENEMKKLEQPSFRAQQILNWIYDKNKFDFAEMTNLGKNLRRELKQHFDLDPLTKLGAQESEDGTIKYLFELSDGEKIEVVYMPSEKGRKTLCISTQVGCAMGCSFCATGLHGLTRNLRAGEIVNQILTVENLRDIEITNVVLMGMGEPLDNYEASLKAISLINGPLNIGMRKITISTCGLVPQIKKLADEELQLTLAVSLHAPNNQLRNKLIPVNQKYPIEELIDACQYYIEKTNRRVTFEYALMDGVNDKLKHAQQLADLLAAKLVHVNLIPINQVQELNYSQPQQDIIAEFETELQKRNIPVTVRKERGADIDAACGQLQGKEE